ncbi:hypothetical protein MMPV_003198 [Pyropia vietnamensis]
MGTPLRVAALADAVLRGETWALSRAITLVESTAASHMPAATELLERVLAAARGGAGISPRAVSTASRGGDGDEDGDWRVARTPSPHPSPSPPPPSLRVAISGSPGVGKSTFIESLGTALTARGERVAVLAIDPSSPRSGGAILGDKTRMAALSRSPLAYVRPTPSGGALGGVARRTDEAVALVEAAGYATVLVESVGVGQSEAAAAAVADVLVLLVPPSAGDGLQAAKRGVLDLADVVAVHKAASGGQTSGGGGAAAGSRGSVWPAPPLQPSSAARSTRQDYAAAVSLVRSRRRYWHPRVVLCDSVPPPGGSVTAVAASPPQPPSLPPLADAAGGGIKAETVLRPIDVWDDHVLPLWRALSRPPFGDLLSERASQREAWARAELKELLAAAAAADPATAATAAALRPRLARGEMTARAAAARMADTFLSGVMAR